MRAIVLLPLVLSSSAFGADYPQPQPVTASPLPPTVPETNQAPSQPSAPMAPTPCPGCQRTANQPMGASPQAPATPAGEAAPAASGDEMRDPTAGQAPPASPPVRPGNEIRDPTKEPKRFREAWRHMVPAPQKGSGSSVNHPAIPDIRLVGRSLGGGRPPSVMLQVEQKTYLMRQGDQFSLLGQGREILTVRVESIGKDGVQLVVLPYGDRLSLF